jgi:hypothetical protein
VVGGLTDPSGSPPPEPQRAPEGTPVDRSSPAMRYALGEDDAADLSGDGAGPGTGNQRGRLARRSATPRPPRTPPRRTVEVGRGEGESGIRTTLRRVAASPELSGQLMGGQNSSASRPSAMGCGPCSDRIVPS